MPGVQENHIHPAISGIIIDQVMGKFTFSELAKPEEIQQALSDYVKANPGEGWITGQKWGNVHFPEGKPNKSMIDAVVRDRPVFLLDETNHNAVVNSKALELAGITKDTPQPEVGVIGKDPKTGEPTGYLAESGMALVMNLVPPPPVDKMKEAVKIAQDILLAYGVSAITDMSGGRTALEAFKAMDEEGALKMRVDFAIIMNASLGEEPDPYGLIADREKYRTRLIDPDRVKYIVDGTPLSGTSIMLEPYANNPESYGQWTLTDAMVDSIPSLIGQGLVLSAHSIGDGTTNKLLDIVAEARKKYPERNDIPVQIAHPMWVHPDDMIRMKELNVVAEVSPPLYFPSGLMNALPPILGESRVQKAFQIKDFLEAGVVVSYGSDWPASAPNANPWRALEGLITRKDPDGTFEGGPLGEPIGLDDALKILTLNGAISMGHSDVTGSIKEGNFADMIILDANPFELIESGQPDKIGDMSVVKTIFEGEVVYKMK